MTTPLRAGVIAIATVALGIGLAACGSDSTTDESTTESTTSAAETSSEAAPTSPQAEGPAAGPAMTIDEYIAENGIVQTPMLPGDPGAPTVTLPYAEGWQDMGDQTPEGAYAAMVFTGDPSLTDPPTLVARMYRLEGDVDPAKILEYSISDVQNLPGFQGPDTGQQSSLAGFDAVQIGGFYDIDGTSHMVAQKTVAIPGQDGLYLLQIKAEGPEEQAYPLMDATADIDEQATIVP